MVAVTVSVGATPPPRKSGDSATVRPGGVPPGLRRLLPRASAQPAKGARLCRSLRSGLNLATRTSSGTADLSHTVPLVGAVRSLAVSRGGRRVLRLQARATRLGDAAGAMFGNGGEHADDGPVGGGSVPGAVAAPYLAVRYVTRRMAGWLVRRVSWWLGCRRW